jgi:hypothetical protein
MILILLTFGCSAPCSSAGDSVVSLDPLPDGASTVRAVPWEDGWLLVWQAEGEVRVRRLDAEGAKLGNRTLEEMDGTLFDAVVNDDTLLLLGNDAAAHLDVRADVYDGDFTPLSSSHLELPYYEEPTTMRVVGSGESFGVTEMQPDAIGFGIIGEDPTPEVHAVDLGRDEAGDAHLGWSGAGYAGVWGDDGEPLLFATFEADGTRRGPVTPLVVEWTGVAAAPVWTGTSWMAVAGVHPPTDEPAMLVVAGFGPAGLRKRWDMLLGDLPAQVVAIDAAWGADAGVVTWLAGGMLYATPVGAELVASGCSISTMVPADGILATRYTDDGVRVLAMAVTGELWMWRVDVPN